MHWSSSTSSRVSAGSATLVDALSFTIRPGEVLALIGESGSGKTTTALALMGHARRGCRISGGSVRIGDVDVLSLGARQLRALRGRTVSYIAQSAAASFDPSRTILDQVVEPAVVHGTLPRGEAELKAIALFRELALPEPETIGQRYPHQVSGGQLQRLMAAMALITDPEVVILDEPTTALDVTTQVEVLRAFRRVVRERQVTAVYVSHDLAVVAQMADHILVLRDGRMREVGTTERLLAAPQNDYTQSLLAAAQAGHARRRHGGRRRRGAAAREGAQRRLRCARARRQAGGDHPRGHRPGAQAWAGDRRHRRIGFGQDDAGACRRRIAAAQHGHDGVRRPRAAAGARGNAAATTCAASRSSSSRPTRRSTRRRPSSASWRGRCSSIAGCKGEPLRRRIDELLDLVKLPRTLAERLPGGLSGGQKQRVNLARALAADPDLILCDEVTSALDTVVGAAVLDLIAELRRELGVSYLFISHDLHTVRAVCDEIVVMRHGRKLAQVARADYERGPHHPYYEELARAVPELRRGWLDELDRARPALVA